MDIAENMLQAMDILFKERIKSINFDTTINCTIVDAKSADTGKYTVSNGSTTFVAYSTETGYKKNDAVLVTVPNGDYNQQKIIIGRQVTTSNTPFVFQSPFETLVDVTSNLIEGEYKDMWLWANHAYKGNPDVDKHMFWKWSVSDATGHAALTGYTRIGLRGEFSTWLSNLGCIEGTYGILLRVGFKANPEDPDDASYKSFFLDSSEFYGNVYGFDSYYAQEAVFDISTLKDQYITSMGLYFYQNRDFKTIEGEAIDAPPYTATPNDDLKYYGADIDEEELSEVFDSEDESAFYILPNIYMRDPYICLGYDLGSFQKEDSMLLTLDTLTYDLPVASGADYTDEDRYKKTIGLRWIHDFGNDRMQAVSKQDFINNLGEDPRDVQYEIRWYRYSAGARAPDNYAGMYWVQYRVYKTNTAAVLELPLDIQYLQQIITTTNNLLTLTQAQAQELNNNYLNTYNTAFDELANYTPTPGWYLDCAKELVTNQRFGNEVFTLLRTTTEFNPETGEEYDTAELEEKITTAKNYLRETLSLLTGIGSGVEDPFNISFYPNAEVPQEQFKVIILKDGSTISRSNILTFTNDRDLVSDNTVDVTDALSILCGHRQDDEEIPFYLEPEQGNFFIYKKGNDLLDAGRAKERFSLTAAFKSIKDSNASFLDNLLTEATCITWMFPSRNTMLRPVFYENDFIELGNFETHDPTTEEIELLTRAFGEVGNRQVISQTEDTTLLATYNLDTGLFELTHFGDLVSGDLSGIIDKITAHYFIKKTYAPNLVDNTVHCQIIKDKLTYHATKDLLFGQNGTSGSAYTLVLTFDNNQNALSVYGEKDFPSGVQGAAGKKYYSTEGQAMDLGDIWDYYKLIAQVHLYGQDGQEIDLLTSTDINLDAYKNIPEDSNPDNLTKRRSLGLILRNKYTAALPDSYWQFFKNNPNANVGGVVEENAYHEDTTVGALLKEATKAAAFNILEQASRPKVKWDWLVHDVKTDRNIPAQWCLEENDLLYPVFFSDQHNLLLSNDLSGYGGYFSNVVELDRDDAAFRQGGFTRSGGELVYGNYSLESSYYYITDYRTTSQVFRANADLTNEDFYYYNPNSDVFEKITLFNDFRQIYTGSLERLIVYRHIKENEYPHFKIGYEIFQGFSELSGIEIVSNNGYDWYRLDEDGKVIEGNVHRALTSNDVIYNAAEVLYEQLGKLYVQRNGVYVLDPDNKWNEAETYYYPIYTEESENLTSPLIVINENVDTANTDPTSYGNTGDDGNITRRRITINPAFYNDEDSHLTLSELMNSLNIIKVTLSNFGDYDLVTYWPIPIRRVLFEYENNAYAVGNGQTRYALKSPKKIDHKHWYDSIEGATSIRYSSSGEVPDYYKNPYKAYNIQNGRLVEDENAYSREWRLLIPATAVNSGANAQFLPQLINNVLQPLATYIPNAPYFGVQYLPNDFDADENAAFWTQPILVYQDNYPSSTINAWNGTDISTDDSTGSILASALAAGKKEKDNTFSGVMIGDWSRTDTVSSITKQTGIYGFHKGAMSYAFKEDGTGFIGKDGKGRIFLGGDNSTIYSNNWLINKTGMMMDLDDGYIHMANIVQEQLMNFNSIEDFITFVRTKENSHSLWKKEDFIALPLSSKNSAFNWTSTSESTRIYIPDLSSEHVKHTEAFGKSFYLPQYKYFCKIEQKEKTEGPIAKKQNWQSTSTYYYDIVRYEYDNEHGEEDFPAIIYETTSEEKDSSSTESSPKYNYYKNKIIYLALSQDHTGRLLRNGGNESLYYTNTFIEIVKENNKSFSQHALFTKITSSTARTLIKGAVFVQGDSPKEGFYGYEVLSSQFSNNSEPNANHYDILGSYYLFDNGSGNITRYITLGANERTYPLAIGVEKSTSRRPFRIRWDGKAFISDGDFTGNIRAMGGSIEGDLDVYGTLTGGIFRGGEMYTSYLEAYHGVIGGWEITQTSLQDLDDVTYLFSTPVAADPKTGAALPQSTNILTDVYTVRAKKKYGDLISTGTYTANNSEIYTIDNSTVETPIYASIGWWHGSTTYISGTENGDVTQSTAPTDVIGVIASDTSVIVASGKTVGIRGTGVYVSGGTDLNNNSLSSAGHMNVSNRAATIYGLTTQVGTLEDTVGDTVTKIQGKTIQIQAKKDVAQIDISESAMTVKMPEITFNTGATAADAAANQHGIYARFG